jgi:hypothetical protein
MVGLLAVVARYREEQRGVRIDGPGTDPSIGRQRSRSLAVAEAGPSGIGVQRHPRLRREDVGVDRRFGTRGKQDLPRSGWSWPPTVTHVRSWTVRRSMLARPRFPGDGEDLVEELSGSVGVAGPSSRE